MAKKLYTEAEIYKILEIYVMNKYSVKKTSEQTHVARNTLNNWIQKYPINKQPEIQKAVITEVTETFSPDAIESRSEISADIDDTKDKLLKRMNDLIPDCRSIDTLSRAYQVLHMCQQGINPMGANGDVYNTVNLVQMYGKELDQKNVTPSKQ